MSDSQPAGQAPDQSPGLGPELVIVLITAGSEAEAQQLAQRLVGDRLAACVTVWPVTSVYRWQGTVETAGEWQLVVKTDLAQFDRLCQTVRAIHSYDLPEIIALPIAAGLPDYLAWMRDQLR